MKRYAALIWLIRLFKGLAWLIFAMTPLIVALMIQPLGPWSGLINLRNTWFLEVLVVGGAVFSLGVGMALMSHVIGLMLDMVMDIAYNVDRVANAKTELVRAQLQAISQARTPRLADDRPVQEPTPLPQEGVDG
ncbi:MAG: hypothetical protein NZ750_10825 [Anaerolineae bacterium]|nr:hypothetical protein [Anaerolineae bacterium]MDW8171556.1 hypothetical protein [Anaerolineae bacterium]